MANYKTGAQRYNDRMDKIFSEGRRLNEIHDKGRAAHAKGKHKGEYSSCSVCGNNSKAKALKEAKN